MQKTKLLIGIFLLTALLLAACSGEQTANNVMDDMKNDTTQPADMNDDHSEDMPNDSMDDSMDDSNDGMMDDKNDDMMEDENENMSEEGDNSMGESSASSPDWYAYEFTDAVTGEKFSISQFKGQVVLVETMATWCSNCLKQQQQLKELHQMLGEREDFVSIGISVELEIDPGVLGMYLEKNGFTWLYGIADQSVQQSIAASFGGQYLNPPATPIFIVDKNGYTHELPLGKIKSADELLSYVESYLN